MYFKSIELCLSFFFFILLFDIIDTSKIPFKYYIFESILANTLYYVGLYKENYH